MQGVPKSGSQGHFELYRPSTVKTINRGRKRGGPSTCTIFCACGQLHIACCPFQKRPRTDIGISIEINRPLLLSRSTRRIRRSLKCVLQASPYCVPWQPPAGS